MFKKLTTKMHAMYACATVAAASTLMPTVMASGDLGGEANEMVLNLVNVICTIFRYIGILLLVWAIGMLVLAFKNEDANSKTRSMMLLVVSIVLIAIKSIVMLIIPTLAVG